jgi:3-phytase
LDTTTGRNRTLGTFRVAGAGVDGINGSDGLAITNRVVGNYRKGLLVTHDEPETERATRRRRSRRR